MYRNRSSVSKPASLKSAQRKGAKPAGWRSKLNYFERLESRAMLAADAYQNAANQFDVNGDGHVTPMDALTIINDLNKYGSHPLTTLASDFAGTSSQTVTAQAASGQAGGANFMDVNGDGVLSPLDALKVINALNSNDLAQVTLVVTDMNGVPISSIPVGSQFQIEAFVADVSGNATAPVGTAIGSGGVFEAEIDGTYNSALASIDPNATITYGSNYVNGQVSDLSNPGQIVGTGAFAGLNPLGPGQIELWSIPVTANATGVETFTPSPGTALNSKGVSNEVALYGLDTPVPNSQIDFEPGSVTIVPATTPIVSISPATVARPTNAISTVNEVFNVTLTNPSSTSPTTVTYSTADGTAKAGTDYVGVSNQTVTFPAGATSENITVVVKGSAAYDPSSNFTVNLSNPTNGATIGTIQATGTITSTVAKPTFAISGPTTVIRPSSGVVNEVYTVTLTGSTELYAAVNYTTTGTTTNPATPGTDYTTTSGQLVFPVGTTSETITVPVLGNTSTTGNVGFNVNLRTPTNATVTSSVVTTTITPPPTVDLSITKSDDKGGTSGGSIGNVTPGTPITYTITVSNSGPSTATGATVADTLPAGITGDTWTASATGGATGFSVSGTGAINDTAVNLPSGSVVTYTVIANVSASATGTLSNTATVTAPAGATDTNTANNSATDVDNLVPTADLSITKVDNMGGSSINNTTGSVTPGSTLTYTIVVTNHGPIAVTGAAVADTLPAGISSDTWNATASGGATGFSASGTGAISDSAVNLPVNSTITYTVIANVAASASGTLTNTATVTPPTSPIDPNLTNNSATDSDTVVQTADLSITKTDDQGGSSVTHANGSVVPGTTLTYTIVVTNNGPSAANGVKVADTLPAGVVSDTWSAASTTGATGFTSTPTSGPINDTAVNMPAGSIVTYTVVAHINSSATGSLSNTATVTAPAGVSDSNSANNTATDTDTLTPNADLSITKSDNKGGSSSNNTTGSVTPGNPLVYTIVVSNAGPSTASGVTIADTLPAGISSDTWTAASNDGATGFSTSGSGAINASGVNLPSGSSITYTINANVSASAFGTLSNTATVTAAVGTTDPNTTNNSATDVDNLVPTADLSITKTDNKGGSSSGNTTGTASPGSTITYTITVTNAGPVEADGAQIADTLPAGILSDTYTAIASGGATGFSTGMSGAISDTVNMPSGSSIVYTVTAVTDPAASGLLSNTATVTAPGSVTDPNLSNNSATDKLNLVPQTDLSITKVDNVGGSSIGNTIGTATNGGTITYTIVVTNTGPANATGATISDTLPAAFSSTSFSATATGGATGFSTSGNGNIDDTAVNIPVGGIITYVVTANLASNFAGSISNTATVTAPAGDSDPNTANNSATDTDTVPGVADLVVTKSDNAGGSSSQSTTGTVIPGQQLVYTVVVTNNGPSDVTGASIVDTLPAGITSATYSAAATGGATGFKASGTGSIDDTAVNLPVGSTVTYTVTANVSATATGTLSNTATASVPAGFTDPQSTNNSATDTDNLTPTADLSITKVDNVGGSSVTGAIGNVVKGQSITYTIVVTNNGPSTATGTSIVDSLPASIASDTFTATATGGATNFTASGTGSISDANVTLPAGSTVTYTVVALVSTSATSTNMSNTATVTAGTGVADTNSANNSATDVDNVAVFTPSSLSGTEFIDSDGNGLRGTSELEVQNATIHLTGTDFLNTAVSLTTNTAADGSYSFGNLNPGTYTITAVQSPFLTAGQAIVGTEGGTAPDANDIKVTIGAAGGITGTGNNFTEKSFASVAISERILLASSHLNGTVDLNNTSLFPSTASASVASTPSASSAVSSSMLLASSAVASSPSATSAVDAAFADPRLLD